MSTDSASETTPEKPKSLVEKMGAALPVGLTALATVFAGMSTAALQQSMYWKSQAAQDQSRAANQWSLAGFKRERALIMQTTASQLRALAGYALPDLSSANLPSIKIKPDESNADQKRKEFQEVQAKALEWLKKKSVPPSPLPEIGDENIVTVQKAIESREPETEILKIAARIKFESINKVIDDAEKKSEQYDKEWGPIIAAAAEIASNFGGEKTDNGERNPNISGKTNLPDDPSPTPDEKTKPSGKNEARIARQASGYDLEERRYRAESRLNQGIGYLYDVRVKVSSAESDKHRRKYQLFFYAMLGAQIGATISALSLANRTKNALWVLAALIGLGSIGFGAYVFLEQ